MQTAAPSPYSELYAAYAAGRLDPAFSLMLETQTQLRGDVRAALAVSETLSGAMLERAEPVAMRAGAGGRALALIDALEAAEETAGADLAEDKELSGLPRPLQAPGTRPPPMPPPIAWSGARVRLRYATCTVRTLGSARPTLRKSRVATWPSSSTGMRRSYSKI